MKFEDKLITEEAPPDTASYEEGSVGMLDEQPKEEQGNFSFYEALRGMDINE